MDHSHCPIFFATKGFYAFICWIVKSLSVHQGWGRRSGPLWVQAIRGCAVFWEFKNDNKISWVICFWILPGTSNFLMIKILFTIKYFSLKKLLWTRLHIVFVVMLNCNNKYIYMYICINFKWACIYYLTFHKLLILYGSYLKNSSVIHGQRNLGCHSPWGHKEPATT